MDEPPRWVIGFLCSVCGATRLHEDIVEVGDDCGSYRCRSCPIPPCDTPGCCLTRGHALSPSDTPCLQPLGPITHRRTAYPTAEGMARIRAEWDSLRGH